MRMVDLIELKKNNHELTKEQIHFIIKGYNDGNIPDYQMSAFLMAICFNGLSKHETAILTDEMLHSGEPSRTAWTPTPAGAFHQSATHRTP